jgi:hypothetical protein
VLQPISFKQHAAAHSSQLARAEEEGKEAGRGEESNGDTAAEGRPMSSRQALVPVDEGGRSRMS